MKQFYNNPFDTYQPDDVINDTGVVSEFSSYKPTPVFNPDMIDESAQVYNVKMVKNKEDVPDVMTDGDETTAIIPDEKMPPKEGNNLFMLAGLGLLLYILLKK
jgi:hypothetical protein